MSRQFKGRKIWTATEDTWLTQMVRSKQTCSQIARALLRTESSINSRCFVLGLRKYRCSSSQDDERVIGLLRSRKQPTDAEVGRKMGLSRQRVARIRRRFSIPPLSRSEWTKKAHIVRRRPHEPTTRENDLLVFLESGPKTTPQIIKAFNWLSRSRIYMLLYSLRGRSLVFCEGRGGGSVKTWYSTKWWLSNNKGIAWSVAIKVYKMNNKLVELEDIHHTVILKMAAAARTYRPGRGAKFITYAAICGHHEACSYCMAEKQRGVHVPQYMELKHAPPVVSSIEAYTRREDTDAPLDFLADKTPEPDIDPLPRGKAFWDEITDLLPLRLRFVFLCLFREGMILREVAQKIGKCRERIRQLKEQALAMIRESGVAKKYEVYLDGC